VGREDADSQPAADLVQTWQEQETRRLLDERPTIDQAAMLPLLPRPGTAAWSNYAVFAGIRLTDIVEKGCQPYWWAAHTPG
jgi:hypothetical protein